jgi:hypothetical protein
MKTSTRLNGAMMFALLLATQTSEAREGPWCAYEKGGLDFVARRCDLPNYEACRAWIHASPGTWCTQNPYYGWDGGSSVQKSRSRRAR